MSIITEEISVIIAVKNGEKTIGRCLESIFNQSYRPLEVIVVDGHSTDKTVEIVRKFPVKIFFENYGTVGGALRVGLEEAMGRYVALTDADCIPEKDWLENLIKEFDEGIVGVGGGIRDISDGIWGKSIGFGMNTFLGSARSVQGRIFKNKRFVKSISGANSMYLKEDIEKVGGHNLDVEIEDIELNRRLLKIGKFLYTPNAVVLHDQGRGPVKFARRMYEYGRGKGRYRLLDLQEVPPMLAPLLLLLIIFTPWIFLVVLTMYILALMFNGLKFGYREKSIWCFLSLPLFYIIEHSSYTIGFWYGVFERMFRKQKTRAM